MDLALIQPGEDCAGRDLRHFKLIGADLRGCNFSGADLQEADLRYADVRSANFNNARCDDMQTSLWVTDPKNSGVRPAKKSGKRWDAIRKAWDSRISERVMRAIRELNDAEERIALREFKVSIGPNINSDTAKIHLMIYYREIQLSPGYCSEVKFRHKH